MRRRFVNSSNYNYKQFDAKYMTIEALEGGLIVSFTSRDVEYSINGGQWKTLGEKINSPLLNKGDFFSARCVVNKGEIFGSIIGNGKAVNLRGNIMSLLFGDDGSNSLEGYNSVFIGTFTDLNVINIERGFLPATTLAKSCYSSMFSDCINLATAPELPATTLASDCYSHMFYGCIKLTTAPELPANILASWCYNYMFFGCTSLTTAPTILPATTLVNDCYFAMFENCTSLVNAPELPATTLVHNCYHTMFHNCTNLNHIKMLATDVSASNCLRAWVSGVAPTGTFVKHKDAVLPTGTSGIPSGWTVVNDGEESGNDIVVPLTNGYGELTEEQISYIIEYCSQFGDNWNSIPEGFELTFNGMAPENILFRIYNGEPTFNASASNFDCSIQNLNYGYLLVF